MARFTRHSFSSEIYLLKSKGEILSQIPLFDSFWRDSLDRFFLEIPLQLRHQVLSFSINRISVVWRYTVASISFYLSLERDEFGRIFPRWENNRQSSHVHVDHSIHGREAKSVRVSEQNGESFDANFLRNHSLSPWGKGAYGINFLRVYASPGDQ